LTDMSMAIDSQRLDLQTVDAVNLGLEIAGIGSRAYAFTIDLHIRVLAALAWLLPATWLLPRFGTSLGEAGILLMLGPPALIYLLYHPVLEIAMRGRTPGKRYASLRILTLDGRTPGAGALLLRNIFRILDSMPGVYALGLVAMAVTAQRTRIGDIAAGTVVVFDGVRHAGALDALRAEAAMSPQATLLVRELLDRWPELEAGVRRQLAQRLLEPSAGDADALVIDGETDEQLRARLAAQLAHG
jgi:uncharacterized RDD family membrane protein YckC